MELEDKIIELTKDSVLSITHGRFFANERAYQGRLYCHLFNKFESIGMLDNNELLEIEYQKSKRHDLSQRPDIIYHIPAEVSEEGVDKNNYAVWALKRMATSEKAIDDFGKLDEMLSVLKYSLGIFINIGSDKTYLDLYNGNFKEKIIAFGVICSENKIHLALDRYDKSGKLVEFFMSQKFNANIML